MKANVLIVEDEEDLAQLTVLYLEREGIACRVCLSAEAAQTTLKEECFDLVILDLNLPGMDGFEFLQAFRKNSSVPVMIVSAREADEDVISGLSVGADEFVSKPIAPRVLVARVRALLRRARTTDVALDGAPDANYAGNSNVISNANYVGSGGTRRVLAFGDYSLDLDACLLRKAGERIPLSAREFDVLGFLVENAGKAFSPQEIYDRVWGQHYGDPTTIGVYVQRIRKKIEVDPKVPRLIETVKGKGYRFESAAFGGH